MAKAKIWAAWRVKIEYYIGLPYDWDDGVQLLTDRVREFFPNGATINFGLGIWQGKLEKQATVTEIDFGYTNKDFLSAVIKDFGQEMVIVAKTRVGVEGWIGEQEEVA